MGAMGSGTFAPFTEEFLRRSFLHLDVSEELLAGIFQTEAGGLVDAEHEVHVLHGLTDGTFQEVVDTGGDKQLVVEGIDVDETFVGIHHLLEVERLGHNGVTSVSVLKGALTDKINDGEIFMKGIDYSYYYEQED